MRQPLGLALRILELRGYARAKRALEAAQKPGDVQGYPMVGLVWDVLHELKRQGSSGGGG